MLTSRRSDFVTQSLTTQIGQGSWAILPHFYEWGLMVKRKVSAVLFYLQAARACERDPWIADDYQVAWQVVRLAAEGAPDPYRLAFIGYFGAQPETALKQWAERERQLKEYLHASGGVDSRCIRYTPRSTSGEPPNVADYHLGLIAQSERPHDAASRCNSGPLALTSKDSATGADNSKEYGSGAVPCPASDSTQNDREATNGVNPQGQSTVGVASAVKEQPTQGSPVKGDVEPNYASDGSHAGATTVIGQAADFAPMRMGREILPVSNQSDSLAPIPSPKKPAESVALLPEARTA